MEFLCSAFSLGMLPEGFRGSLAISPGVPPPTAASAVGHASTATVYAALILVAGDAAYVGVLRRADGTPYRPPEGVVLGPADFAAIRIEWMRIEVRAHE